MKTGSSSLLESFRLHYTGRVDAARSLALVEINDHNVHTLSWAGSVAAVADKALTRGGFQDLGYVIAFGHALRFDVAFFQPFLEVLPARVVTLKPRYFTITREPWIWLRSLYQHVGERQFASVGGLSAWVSGPGLASLASHYTLSLPSRVTQALTQWTEAHVEAPHTDVRDRPRGAKVFQTLSNVGDAATLLRLHSDVDWGTVEQHYAENYLVLCNEYYGLSLEVLSFALYGDVAVFREAKRMVHTTGTFSNLTQFDAETMRQLGPVIAPFQRLYGILFDAFVHSVTAATHDFGAHFSQPPPKRRLR